MPTSGSYNYSVTANEVITAALENIGAIVSGETADANDVTICLRQLNMIAKALSGNSNQGPGFKTWTRKMITLFLANSDNDYTLGPSGDKCILRSALGMTTIRVSEIAGQTALDVTSTTGMSSTMIIGIVQNNNTIHWSTISSTGAGPVVNIAAATTFAANAGNPVFFYAATGAQIPYVPISVEKVTLMDEDGNETPVDRFTSMEEYFSDVTSKTQSVDPGFWIYERGLGSGTFYIDGYPADVSKRLQLLVTTPTEDYDATSDDIAYPAEWYDALSWMLAKRVAPKFDRPWTPDREANYVEAMGMARAFSQQDALDFFQPEED